MPRQTVEIVVSLREQAALAKSVVDETTEESVKKCASDLVRTLTEAADRLEAATIPMTYGFIGQSVGEKSGVYIEQLHVGSRWLAGLIESGEVDARRR